MESLIHLTRAPDRPQRSDLVLVAALAVWALLEATFEPGPHGVGLRTAFALAISLPLLVRRQLPFAVAVALSAMSLVWLLAANRASAGAMPGPCLLVAAFQVALTERSAALAVLGGAVVVGTGVVAPLTPGYDGTPTAGNVIALVFFFGGAWLAGWLLRRHAAQTQRAQAESGELARAAVGEERARIARELHDVVAHSVSIIAVQAGAAEELIDRDPSGAEAHLASVRRTAREAMGEMRRLLDVLRAEDTGYAPQPGLDGLPELIESAREAGVAVELVTEGERPRLPAGLELVVFRVLQESLTNVRKHAAGGSARVVVAYRDDELQVSVTNTPGAAGQHNGTGGGHGLIGMRERVRLFGGRLETGAASDGGFRVCAWLPRVEEAR